MKKIHIVDQDLALSSVLKNEIQQRFKCQIQTFISSNHFIKTLKKQKPDVVLLDLNTQKKLHEENIELLKDIQILSPTTNTIIMSHKPKLDKAVEYIRYGAIDCFDKTSENIVLEIKKAISTLLNITENKDIITNLDKNMVKMRKQFWIFNAICALLITYIYLFK